MENKGRQKPDAGKARFIEQLGLYYEGFGVPRIGGRIIGLLLTASGPLSAEVIAETLKVSRSSVSTNMKLLVLSSIVEKALERENRTDSYVLSDHAWEGAIQARIDGMKSLKQIASQGIGAMAGEGTSAARLQEMAEWADTMIAGYDLILAQWSVKKGSMPEQGN